MTAIHSFLFIAPVLLLTFREGLCPFSSLYFIIVTLSTVGYGDFNPLNPMDNGTTTLHKVLLNIAAWIYMTVGLSLFGNLIRFIQYRIEFMTMECEGKVTSSNEAQNFHFTLLEIL